MLGDDGKLYVPPELVAVYRDKVLPMATVLTPNQFEVEQLTGGGAVASLEDAAAASLALHAKGPRVVVITR